MVTYQFVSFVDELQLHHPIPQPLIDPGFFASTPHPKAATFMITGTSNQFKDVDWVLWVEGLWENFPFHGLETNPDPYMT